MPIDLNINTSQTPTQAFKLLSHTTATMRLTAPTILAGAVASVSAAALASRDLVTTYTLTVESDDPTFKKGIISASQGKLWVSLPDNVKDAVCGEDPDETLEHGVAKVFLIADELFLYNRVSEFYQMFAVDKVAPGRFSHSSVSILLCLPVLWLSN